MVVSEGKEGGRGEESAAENLRLNLLEAYMRVRYGERPEFWSSSKGMASKGTGLIGRGDDEYHRPNVEWWRNVAGQDVQEMFARVLHAEFDRLSDDPSQAKMQRKGEVFEGIQHVWDLVDTGENRVMMLNSSEALTLQEILLSKLELLQSQDKLPPNSADALKLQRRRIRQIKQRMSQPLGA